MNSALDTLTTHQRIALRAVYSRMCELRRWPHFSVIDHDLDQLGLSTEAVLSPLRPRYVLFDPHLHPGSQVSLTAAGVLGVQDLQASADAVAFWRLIQLALRALTTHVPNPEDPFDRPQISRGDLETPDGTDREPIADDVALRAFLILQAEGVSSGSSGPSANGDWAFSVGREFRRWRAAPDLPTFVAMRSADRESIRAAQAPPAIRAAGRVFVSFAARDSELAMRLYDFLRAGCNLSEQQVFLTARPGQLDPGVTFVDAIRESVRSATIVVLVLTPAYYESRFCLAELGGAWALELPCVPLLVPPVDYAELEGVQLGVQALRLDQASDLDALRDHISSTLGSRASTAEWNRHRDQFLDDWQTGLQSRVSRELTSSMARRPSHPDPASGTTDFDHDGDPRLARTGADSVASVAANGLDVTIEHVRWEGFKHEALIATIRLRIANQTGGSKRLHSFGCRAVEGLSADGDVAARVAQVQEAHPLPSSAIAPYDFVSGWLVYTFKHRPAGGTPEFELLVEDEIRNEYVLPVAAVAPRTFSGGEKPDRSQ